MSTTYHIAVVNWLLIINYNQDIAQSSCKMFALKKIQGLIFLIAKGIKSESKYTKCTQFLLSY